MLTALVTFIVVLATGAFILISAGRMLRKEPSSSLISYLFFVTAWYALQLYMMVYLFSPVFLPADSQYGYFHFNSIFAIPLHGAVAFFMTDLTFKLLGSNMPRVLKLALPLPFLAVLVTYTAGVLRKLAINRSPEEFTIAAPVSGVFVIVVIFASLVYGVWRSRRIDHPFKKRIFLFAVTLGAGTAIGLAFVFGLLSFLEFDVQNGLSILVCSAVNIPAWYAIRDLFRGQARAVAEELAKADLSLLEERYGISPREREIVSLVITGRSNREIVRELFISEETVKKHIYNIYKKMGVRSRVQLVNAVLSVSRRV